MEVSRTSKFAISPEQAAARRKHAAETAKQQEGRQRAYRRQLLAEALEKARTTPRQVAQ